MTRATDDPSVPADLHHRLDVYEREVAQMRGSLNELSMQVSDLRVTVATALSKRVQLPGWANALLSGLLGIALLQGGGAIWWGSSITRQVDQLGKDASRLTTVMESQGPIGEAMRSDCRELRARVASLEVKTQEGTDDRFRRRDWIEAKTDLHRELGLERQRIWDAIAAIQGRNAEADKRWQGLAERGLLNSRGKP